MTARARTSGDHHQGVERAPILRAMDFLMGRTPTWPVGRAGLYVWLLTASGLAAVFFLIGACGVLGAIGNWLLVGTGSAAVGFVMGSGFAVYFWASRSE